MYHRIEIIGRLGSDAELRYTNGGKSVCSCRVAVDVGYGANKKTAWVKVTLFDKLAESLAPHLQKGGTIMAAGTLSLTEAGEVRVWEDKSGGSPRPRATLEMVATEVRLLGRRIDQQESTPKVEEEEVPF